MEMLKVRTFGEFSLSLGNATLTYRGARSRKIWGLMAYLLCHRDRVISQQKLIGLFWGEESDSANPENALRITLHRARELLDSLQPGLGKQVILHRQDGYCWNPEFPTDTDFGRFEELCLTPEPAESRADRYLEAIALYGGDFLAKLSTEMWAIPLAAHFQNQYLTVTIAAAELLLSRDRFSEAADICRKAVALEPYHEPLCRLLLKALGAMQDPKGAAAVYENLSRRLFEDFGIRPSEETRAIYRQAARQTQSRELPMDEVLEHLQEPEGDPGAMECDYDHFKMICYAQARALGRSGSATHVALISIAPAGNAAMGTATLHRVMDQVGQQLRRNLRRGDVISRCSLSQYILLLPGANYENGCVVCRRCISAFTRSHPHTAVKLQYMVQPLTPNIIVP